SGPFRQDLGTAERGRRGGPHRLRRVRHRPPHLGAVRRAWPRLPHVASLGARRAGALRGRDMAAWSKTWTVFENDWHEGNVPIIGPRTHAGRLGSMACDGARAFEGVTPDLALHCARVNASAKYFHLQPQVSLDGWLGLVADGLKKFDKNAELYIRPMYWAETGSPGGIRHDPESTRWCLCIYEAAIPKPTGASVTLSRFRRPTAECAPVEAKAACLYPNNARAIMEAQQRGFDNCLMRDMLANVAELGTANVFMAKDGVVYTPVANGTFLNGITRQRIIGLLRQDGIAVVEKTMTYPEFQCADEIFSTGNFSK